MSISDRRDQEGLKRSCKPSEGFHLSFITRFALENLADNSQRSRSEAAAATAAAAAAAAAAGYLSDNRFRLNHHEGLDKASEWHDLA